MRSGGKANSFPETTLALYTDGITEAFSPHREEFGEERLVEALRRHRSLPPCELLSSVVDEVRRHSPPRAKRRHYADRREVPAPLKESGGKTLPQPQG